MSFSQDAWEAIGPVRKAIGELPFLTGMEDGTLPRGSFVYYMAQDAHYLVDYGRVLAAAASQTSDTAELVFWARSAYMAVSVERELHAAHVADFAAIPRSPTCTAYTSYLFSLAAAGCYPALVGDLTGHPYADWISTYGDPEFAAATEEAKQIVDRLAAPAARGTVECMHRAFTTASRYEWMFWDAAWRQEAWPLADSD